MVLAYSLGPRDQVSHIIFCPRGCFVLVFRVRALLDRRLAPLIAVVPKALVSQSESVGVNVSQCESLRVSVNQRESL